MKPEEGRLPSLSKIKN